MSELSGGGVSVASRLIVLLGLTQIISYGTLYYGFAVLALEVARDLRVSVPWVLGVASVSLLLGVVIAPIVGRMVDRYGALRIMTIGSAAAAGALLLLSRSTTFPGFCIGMAAVGATSNLVQYNAAFAGIVQVTGNKARRHITHLTLVGGFSSTAFWPLTDWLRAFLSWHQIFVVFGMLNLLVSFPIHWWLAKTMPIAHQPAPAKACDCNNDNSTMTTSPSIRSLLLIGISIGFAASGLVLYGVLSQLVPLLMEMGLAGQAIPVATLFGPAQVLVRVAELWIGRSNHPAMLAIWFSAMLSASVALLALLAPSLIGAVAFVALFGFGSGLRSIAQGTLPLELFGSVGYGALLGRLSAVHLLSAALAPPAFAALMQHSGASVALTLSAGSGMIGVAAFALVRRASSRLYPQLRA